MLPVGISLWCLPPSMPSYAATRSAWRPSEAWLRDRNGRLLETVRINFQVRRLDWVPLDHISPALQQAVIASEDKRFAAHNGVDWHGLAGSAWAALHGHSARGASTITMQLAGFLASQLDAPGARSFRDKLRQIRAARAIEAHWSKDQILEAYLNLASFRGETQGVAAATRSLFGKAPDTLGQDDALLMAALLPSPQADPITVARRACRLGKVGDCDTMIAEAEAMTGATRRLADDPGLAPHLAYDLLRAPGETVRSTLDLNVQAMATSALRRQLLGLGGDRARDGAVVVVDNASGDVLAYVGGVSGGNSTAPAVDNADAYRQAGSTLKPFLYGQAIERGFLTPASILDDSPVQLDTASGLYVPKDYDHDFKGPVSVRTALAGSLNVPAVRALLLDGVEDFRDRLWDMGYRGLTEDGDYYGYSLALGSAEVTLLEQAQAYRALEDGGRVLPLRLRADDPTGERRAVMSPAAAWMVADMMSDPDARAVTFGVDSALRLPFWAAAKTGTSKAMRDNWCIGFSDRFTVAVWVGNAEGDSMTRVSGTSGAAPVWREVMLALHRDRPGAQPRMPMGIERRTVRFSDGVEPSRSEYFLGRTGQSDLIEAPAAARRPRIVNPVSGAVYALDPDIPIDRQRIRLAATGAVSGEHLRMDAQDLGPADDSPMVLPGPGGHHLLLVDTSGKVIDRAFFTVR
ncbi:penicillin-binding protein 1C [Sphingomonas sp. CGMCC 1.13654]|uniref:peptidoglycan glycosyltransferase n=1 Tax=Sphingomonas chungangi TaxID=2683589 RepID=A0A838LAN8_9SPHN|nr:penicillin-binding protein 1C [Sphingomonas chungangi]MBA2936473.1 penicillin-binding protein 1C [Sphingomonas chungangi]MVW55858.1 penicillin-binding protein 1C [Sphingomonas chungangi]